MHQSKSLGSLCLRIKGKSAEDLVIIYAEPTTQDLEKLVRDELLLFLLEPLLWPEIKGQVKAGQKDQDKFSRLKDPGENNHFVVDKVVAVPSSQDDPDIRVNEAKATQFPDDDDGRGGEDDSVPFGEDDDNVSDADDAPLRLEDAILVVSSGDYHLAEPTSQSKVSTKHESQETDASKTEKCEISGGESEAVKTDDKTLCQYCNERFTAAKYKIHENLVCPKKTTCDICKQSFETGRQLRLHNKKKHEFGLKCDYCEYVAKVESYKVIHERKVHLNLDCKVCYKVCVSQEDLKTHNCIRQERFKCQLCEKNYKIKAELKKHVDNIHKGIKFPCPKCKTVLSSSPSLKRHIKNVHDIQVKNYRCDICSKTFKDSDYLQRHKKTHEVTCKSFVCQECGKQFKYKNTLKSHLRTVHYKIFKHTCEECGKCYSDMHKLKVHAEMVHMKGELLVCQLCGKKMIGKNRLRNHMATHPKGQKFVGCPQCGKEVAETQLRSHIVAAHKMQAYKFPCDYCPKRLDTKAHIRAHIRKHTGARPYLCRGCSKYYPLLETAQKHTRIFHGGDYSLIFYDVTKDINNPYVSSSV